MPCYFVSSGVEIPMTNETFDLIWNGFGNKELTDSETSSSSQEGGKTGSSGEKTGSAEWRKQDDGYYNRKPNDETHFIYMYNHIYIYILYIYIYILYIDTHVCDCVCIQTFKKKICISTCIYKYIHFFVCVFGPRAGGPPLPLFLCRTR